MWEILLEFICGVGELLDWWRFFACLALSLGLVGLIYWLVPNGGWRLGLSIPVSVIGIGGGIVWQCRED